MSCPTKETKVPFYPLRDLRIMGRASLIHVFPIKQILEMDDGIFRKLIWRNRIIVR